MENQDNSNTLLNDYLRKLLKESVLNIKFTKKDGTTRDMRCTLVDQFIPTATKEQYEEKRTRARNPDVLSVWDLDKKGWRSFRVDSVLCYTEED